MKYLLMIYADEAGMASAKPADTEQILAAYNAYTKAMVDANRAIFAINSAPNEGTLVEITFPSQRVLAG